MIDFIVGLFILMVSEILFPDKKDDRQETLILLPFFFEDGNDDINLDT